MELPGKIGKAEFGGQGAAGDQLYFVSRGFRLKVAFSEIKAAKAVDGELRLETAQGTAVFELGKVAENWCEKILHPKSRIEKLGVKAGAKIRLMGKFETEFHDEVQAAAKGTAKDKDGSQAETIFLAVGAREELAHLARIAKAMRGATSLWIVYAKGQKTITENDVIGAGRKVGLKDVKVVGFSATHTALKFVIPVERR